MPDTQNAIREWPAQVRPRERMAKDGPESLSEAELLGIILRTGNHKTSAMDLARALLQQFGGLRGIDSVSMHELQKVKGIGLAKAAQVKAALEISKRFVVQELQQSPTISSSDDFYNIVKLRMRDLKREEFRVVYLSMRNEIISERLLFTGTLAESTVSPREIIKEGVLCSAASAILYHNHPSGNPSPSNADKNVTRKIIKACHYVDLVILDHIIIGKNSYYSFADHGLL